jgi:hypothetical protein
MGGYTSELGTNANVTEDKPEPIIDPTRGACTQQVMTLKNPETGETTTATDGCQIERLKGQGWVPATASKAKDPNGTGGTAAQQAGFGDVPVALLALAGVGYGLYRLQSSS